MNYLAYAQIRHHNAKQQEVRLVDPRGVTRCWQVTLPLAQAVEAAGEVVTDGWSDWRYAKGERPEAALESLGLADLIG